MLGDTGAPVLLTQPNLVTPLYNEEELRIEDQNLRSPILDGVVKLVCLDSRENEIATQSQENPCSEVTSDNLAFVFYTSGSTGTPKAVMWSHTKRNGIQAWEQATYQLTEQDRHVLKSSIGFTLLSREIFWPLLTGGRMIIVPAGLDRDAAYLVKFIAEKKITVITMVPSMLRMLLEQEGLEACAALRHVCTFGEALPVLLRESFCNRLNAELTIAYGATEAPSATLFKCNRKDPRQAITLGQPLPEKEIYLLDENLRPSPLGVPGEIYLGVRLARGYLKRPDLTAEKFIPHLLNKEPGARLYRTGDLGRYLSDGTIELLGRVDDQIKVRGVRIEPAEIEKMIGLHPAVAEGVVVAREDKPGNRRLVAYVVLQCEKPIAAGELRKFLTARLPEHLVPSAFALLEVLPRMANGKVDRRALPAPSTARPELDTLFVAPRTPLELELAAIWAEVLSLDEIGIHDNFLELGGHSLAASQVISRVFKRLRLDVPVRSLFQTPTVADMAMLITDSQAKKLDQQDLNRILTELESLSEQETEARIDREDAGKTSKQ
jgi:amino acid adenylation domain-containing protein